MSFLESAQQNVGQDPLMSTSDSGTLAGMSLDTSRDPAGRVVPKGTGRPANVIKTTKQATNAKETNKAPKSPRLAGRRGSKGPKRGKKKKKKQGGGAGSGKSDTETDGEGLSDVGEMTAESGSQVRQKKSKL